MSDSCPPSGLPSLQLVLKRSPGKIRLLLSALERKLNSPQSSFRKSSKQSLVVVCPWPPASSFFDHMVRIQKIKR